MTKIGNLLYICGTVVWKFKNKYKYLLVIKVEKEVAVDVKGI